MIIRAATALDAVQIAAIQNPVIRDTTITFNPIEKTEQDVACAIQTARCFLVAAVEDKIVGFAFYDQFRGGAGYARAMEHTIVLAPEVRGQGVGRVLMQAIIAHAKAADVGSLWAGVSAENPDGVAFHASLDFVEVARLRRVGFKFGRWIDLILMQKWLGDDPRDKA